MKSPNIVSQLVFLPVIFATSFAQNRAKLVDSFIVGNLLTTIDKVVGKNGGPEIATGRRGLDMGYPEDFIMSGQ